MEGSPIEHQAGGDRLALRPGAESLTARAPPGPEKGPGFARHRGRAPTGRRRVAQRDTKPAKQSGFPRPDSSAAAVDPGRRNQMPQQAAPGPAPPPAAGGHQGDQPNPSSRQPLAAAPPGQRRPVRFTTEWGLPWRSTAGAGIKHVSFGQVFPGQQQHGRPARNPRSWPQRGPALGQPPAGPPAAAGITATELHRPT